jgi:hypothetical protein
MSEPAVELKSEPVVPALSKTPSAAEIMARATAEPVKQSSEVSIDDMKLNPNDLDKIKDPIARKMVEERYKAWESGFNKKFIEVANMKKELEAKVTQVQQSGQFQGWSKDRIREALKDPAFVASVQALQQESAPQTWEGSSDEWSALTPQEKQQFQQLNRQVNSQQAQLNSMLQAQEDEQLRKRYPNYKPEVVNSLWQGLMNGTIQATREDLWKVANHDQAIQQAYQLGLQDRKLDMSEKVNASSPASSMSVSPSNSVPEDVRKKGFGAIGRWRLAQMEGQAR